VLPTPTKPFSSTKLALDSQEKKSTGAPIAQVGLRNCGEILQNNVIFTLFWRESLVA
jgi:hypothetical protein